MKIAQMIVGALLGALFLFAGISFFFMTPPALPEGTPIAMFMGAFGPTGYMVFVKVLEITGGLLVAIPRTRALGLLILIPIIVNILAFTIFIAKGEGLVGLPLGVAVAALFLAWGHRRGLMALLADRG